MEDCAAVMGQGVAPPQGRSAGEVVNTFNQEELANLIYEFGEERRSRRAAIITVNLCSREASVIP